MASNISTLQDIDKIVKETIAETGRINIEQVVDDAEIIGDLGFDSLDTVELIMKLEEKLNISISENEADNLQTVSQIKKAIAKMLKIES